MNPDRLRALLHDLPLPDEERAERRGLLVVRAAFAQRQASRPRPRLARLAIALAIAGLLAALLLSPAGASVRGWVDDVFTVATPRPEAGLAEIPGGGRLLVESADGPWVVRADGSRRLLGEYGEATWSPHGLYLAAAQGRTLTAVEPDGTPRWSLTAGAPVSDPRWSPSGFRIAYRSGQQLRVTAADGTGDHLIDPRVAALAPAWSPRGLSQLAYVDAGGELRIADAETGATLGSATALPGVDELEWGASGALLEASPTTLRVHQTRLRKLAQTIDPGPARGLPLPPGSRLRDAAIDPSGTTVATLLGARGAGGPRSVVLLTPVAGGNPRRLLSVPGRLTELAWAPASDRLLIAWPETDQWLFLPITRGKGRALAGVAAAFAPGGGAVAFPRVEGWCCLER